MNKQVETALGGDSYGAGLDPNHYLIGADAHFNVVSAAFQALYQRPESPLVDDITVFGDDPLSYMAATVLNQSLLRDSKVNPVIAAPYTVQDVPRKYSDIPWANEKAERNFIGVLNGAIPSPIKVYVDEDGSPVLVKKSFDEQSSLLLTDVTHNGIKIPQGSIVAVDRSEKYQWLSRPQNYIEATNIKNIKSFCPLRLSAFSFDPDLREAYVGYAHRPIGKEITIEEESYTLHQIRDYLPTDNELRRLSEAGSIKSLKEKFFARVIANTVKRRATGTHKRAALSAYS